MSDIDIRDNADELGDDDESLGDEVLGDPPQTETEIILDRISAIVANARTVPLSTSVMIDREEVLELISQAIDKFPAEVRESRWLIKEREDFVAKMEREGDDILDAARARSERMVQRSEVVKAAELRARKIIDAAEADARRMRLEVEDFCDQKLGSFEIVLERTMRLVGAGREKLQGSVRELEIEKLDGPSTGEIVGEEGLFDQDNGG